MRVNSFLNHTALTGAVAKSHASPVSSVGILRVISPQLTIVVLGTAFARGQPIGKLPISSPAATASTDACFELSVINESSWYFTQRFRPTRMQTEQIYKGARALRTVSI